jgi:hypothetical protein
MKSLVNELIQARAKELGVDEHLLQSL